MPLPIHRFLALALATALFAGAMPASAQVREQQVPFDTAGRVMVVTPDIADSVGLKSPVWPVSGPFTEARLFKQDEGGYIIVVRRTDDILERYSISLEQVIDIRAHFSGRALASPTPEEVVSERTLEPAPVGPRPESGAHSFATGQVLLATAVYGPALASAVRHGIDDPLAFYGAWFTTVGASLYLARRAPDMNVSFAQSILANHAGLHGAGLGAAVALLATDETPAENDGAAYPTAVFLGGTGGALLGYYAGRRLTAPEAAASAFGADVGLLAGLASVSSRNWLGSNFRRGAATTLIAGTLGGYVAGTFYPRFTSDSVTVGDVISLASTGITGILAAAAIGTAGTDSVEEFANLLTTGLIAGVAAGHVLLVKPRDHTVGEGAMVIAAALGGGYLGANVGAVGGDTSEVRILITAALGSAAGIWLMERRVPPSGARRSSSSMVPRKRRPVFGLDAMSGALAAARTPGRHTVVSIRF